MALRSGSMKTKFRAGDLVKSVGSEITGRMGIIVDTDHDASLYQVQYRNKQLLWVKDWQIERVH